jgi:cell wall assembly regulator SMI1
MAEAILGHRLPDDIRAFYLLHNGLPGLEIIPDKNLGRLLPLVFKEYSVTLQTRSVVANWEFFKETTSVSHMEEKWIKPKGPIAKVEWSPDWIPLFDNTQGDHVFMDLNPPKGGSRGQLIDWWRLDGPKRIIARSFRPLLKRLANDIEHDRYVVEPGHFSVAIIKKTVWKKMQQGGMP